MPSAFDATPRVARSAQYRGTSSPPRVSAAGPSTYVSLRFVYRVLSGRFRLLDFLLREILHHIRLISLNMRFLGFFLPYFFYQVPFEFVLLYSFLLYLLRFRCNSSSVTCSMYLDPVPFVKSICSYLKYKQGGVYMSNNWSKLLPFAPFHPLRN
ncbi:hypothetical protein CPC08DRAFT_71500 [Agrocybe pediades]|nr:hypothetical protein CPC08DRAFT_71500 [Agrocybe pediades]